MRKYVNPDMKVIYFESEDILTSSVGGEIEDGGEENPDD